MNRIALFPLFIGCLGRSASINKFGIKGEDLCLVSNELYRVISLFIDCSLSEKKGVNELHRVISFFIGCSLREK